MHAMDDKKPSDAYADAVLYANAAKAASCAATQSVLVAYAAAAKVAACPHAGAEPEYTAAVVAYTRRAVASAVAAQRYSTFAVGCSESAAAAARKAVSAESADIKAAHEWAVEVEVKMARTASVMSELHAEKASLEASLAAKASDIVVAKAREFVAASVESVRWCEGGECSYGDGCTICMVEFEKSVEVGRMACGHEFHYWCLMRWLERRNTCPLCRHEM